MNYTAFNCLLVVQCTYTENVMLVHYIYALQVSSHSASYIRQRYCSATQQCLVRKQVMGENVSLDSLT